MLLATGCVFSSANADDKSSPNAHAVSKNLLMLILLCLVLNLDEERRPILRLGASEDGSSS
jgi:hypothetical protein